MTHVEVATYGYPARLMLMNDKGYDRSVFYEGLRTRTFPQFATGEQKAKELELRSIPGFSAYDINRNGDLFLKNGALPSIEVSPIHRFVRPQVYSLMDDDGTGQTMSATILIARAFQETEQ